MNMFKSSVEGNEIVIRVSIDDVIEFFNCYADCDQTEEALTIIDKDKFAAYVAKEIVEIEDHEAGPRIYSPLEMVIDLLANQGYGPDEADFIKWPDSDYCKDAQWG